MKCAKYTLGEGRLIAAGRDGLESVGVELREGCDGGVLDPEMLLTEASRRGARSAGFTVVVVDAEDGGTISEGAVEPDPRLRAKYDR